MTKRDAYVAWLGARIGLPYRWGGEGPDAYDCSGLVRQGLIAAGVALPAHDVTAAELAEWFSQRTVPAVTAPGQLVFYGAPRIWHVMTVYRVWPALPGVAVLVGARGGGRYTTNATTAATAGAFVDTVLSSTYQPRNLARVVDPFAGEDA